MKKLALGLLAIALFVGFSTATIKAADIGDTAADFTAQSTMGEITLSGYAGKNVVLAFYYAAFTPV